MSGKVLSTIEAFPHPVEISVTVHLVHSTIEAFHYPVDISGTVHCSAQRIFLI
jgi:hypothetical protein